MEPHPIDVHIDHDTIRMVYQSSDDEKILDMIEDMSEEDVAFVAEQVGDLLSSSPLLIELVDIAVQDAYVNKEGM